MGGRGRGSRDTPGRAGLPSRGGFGGKINQIHWGIVFRAGDVSWAWKDGTPAPPGEAEGQGRPAGVMGLAVELGTCRPGTQAAP